jgi:hypothetical protein
MYLNNLLTEAEYQSVSHLAFKVARRNQEGELVSIHGSSSGSGVVFRENETVALKFEPGDGLKLCAKGLHVCSNPWNCFNPEYGYNIFSPSDVLMIVDVVGRICTDKENVKSCTDALRIVKVLSEDQKTSVLNWAATRTGVHGPQGISRSAVMRGVLYLVLRGRFSMLGTNPVRSDVSEAEMMGWLSSISPSTLHKCIPDVDTWGDPNIWVVRRLLEVCCQENQLRLAEWIVAAGLMLYDKGCVSRVATTTKSLWLTDALPRTSCLLPDQIDTWCPLLKRWHDVL